jgi:hypothetical protein
MAQVTITFEDQFNPGSPGAVRHYTDGNAICDTDRGPRPISQVEVGSKVKRDPRDWWLTVLSVVEAE